MTTHTTIEWTDATWNPVRGCSRVSAGCMNCYAERVAARFSKPGQPYHALVSQTSQGPKWTGQIRRVHDVLDAPLHWAKPRRIFVNSMSDLFHEDVPDEFIDKVFAVMAVCQHHTFQVLTKRPARMLEWFSERWQPPTEEAQRQHHARRAAIQSSLGIEPAPFEYNPRGEDRSDQVEDAVDDLVLPGPGGGAWRFYNPDGSLKMRSAGWPLPNVWLGVSVEDQATADERIPLLLKTPAAVRFISAEPLLGPVDLEPFLQYPPFHDNYKMTFDHDEWRGLDWVIVGGESGPKARPFDVTWARDIVAECWEAETPVFVKQMGSFVLDRNDAGFEGDCGDGWPAGTADKLVWNPYGLVDEAQGAPVRIKLHDRAGTDPQEWPVDLRVRKFPAQP